MVSFLMISANLATLGLLEIKAFWNKGYYAIIYVYDVTNKILSRESNSIANVVMSPKFSSISIREVFITSILWRFDQKKQIFLRDALASSPII